MNFIYGPVPSRRLGFSLGIDIVPYKTCTLDCIYCQLGRTTQKVLERKGYTLCDEILKEAGTYLKKHNQMDFITFSGSGEPTLHSEIGILIKKIKNMTPIPVAVLTNGTLLFREDVQQEVAAADVVIPSLDAASLTMFYRINRPHKSLDIDLIIDGLKRFRRIFEGKIWLEIMLIKGFNDDLRELAHIQQAALQIRPDRIHLNTVVRPPSERYARPLNHKEMIAIQDFLNQDCEIIGSFRAKARDHTVHMNHDILEMTKRRPLTLTDIADVLGVSEANAGRMIARLEAEGMVEEKLYDRKRYYFFRPIQQQE
jgi:wyosine [tRNA(Phe)-imidazoG37] synthetase (radical SAM superfamily)